MKIYDKDEILHLGQNPKQKASILDQVQESLYTEMYGSEEYVESLDNLYIPQDSEYFDYDEDTEELDLSLAKYAYRDPATNEIYYFERKSSYKKDGRHLVFMSEASEYQGRNY